MKLAPGTYGSEDPASIEEPARTRISNDLACTVNAPCTRTRSTRDIKSCVHAVEVKDGVCLAVVVHEGPYNLFGIIEARSLNTMSAGNTKDRNETIGVQKTTEERGIASLPRRGARCPTIVE